MLVEELQGELKKDKNARRADLHLHTIWKHTENGGRVETRGLIKKGMPELVTADVSADERMLVTGLLEEASQRLWNVETLPPEVEVESYNDLFRLILAPARNGRSEVRIMRVHGA
jgi:hypothetical protein